MKDITEKTEKGSPLPPYISFATLTNFIQKLKETTVPPRVDSSVLTNYSGSVARQLVLTLKYMRLVLPSGGTTDTLRNLVKAYGTDEWKITLTTVISDAYQEVIGDLDTDTATYSQLDERFREAGADGVVRDRAVAFYLAALREAGLSYSPHFKKPRRPASPKKAKASTKTKAAAEVDDGDDELDDDLSGGGSTGAAKFNFPIPGKGAAAIRLPADVATDDWEMIDSMIRAYIQRKEKAGA